MWTPILLQAQKQNCWFLAFYWELYRKKIAIDSCLECLISIIPEMWHPIFLEIWQWKCDLPQEMYTISFPLKYGRNAWLPKELWTVERLSHFFEWVHWIVEQVIKYSKRSTRIGEINGLLAQEERWCHVVILKEWTTLVRFRLCWKLFWCTFINIMRK